MADCEDQNNQPFFLNVAQHPIVSDSIPPESSHVALQRFSKVPGVFAPLNSIIEPVENTPLHLLIQLSQLTLSHVTDFNCPGQVLFSVVPTACYLSSGL